MPLPNASRRLVGFLGACGLLAVAGCGGPKYVTVVGTATYDGKPLTGLLVSFNPDPAKGHTARVSCVGRIGPDGKFSLISDDGFKTTKGALLGWYKVTISAPDEEFIPVNKKYTSFKTTDMLVEVVADPQPGAYDLKFTK